MENICVPRLNSKDVPSKEKRGSSFLSPEPSVRLTGTFPSVISYRKMSLLPPTVAAKASFVPSGEIEGPDRAVIFQVELRSTTLSVLKSYNNNPVLPSFQVVFHTSIPSRSGASAETGWPWDDLSHASSMADRRKNRSIFLFISLQSFQYQQTASRPVR